MKANPFTITASTPAPWSALAASSREDPQPKPCSATLCHISVGQSKVSQEAYITVEPFLTLSLNSGRKHWKQWLPRSALSTPGMNSAGMIASLSMSVKTTQLEILLHLRVNILSKSLYPGPNGSWCSGSNVRVAAAEENGDRV